MATKTFKEAYSVLQQHAQTLRDQQEPNIDDLLTIVTESVDAYKVCKERIDAVEKALEKALSNTGAPKEKSAKAKPQPNTAVAVPQVEDGDVPF
jgi:exodeoxyribonuclease VII small subunit